MKFPATLPFSISVPKYCIAMRNYMISLYDYQRFLTGELDDELRDIVDHALSRIVNETFVTLLRDGGRSLQISQCVQYSVNAGFLVRACDYFEAWSQALGDSRFGRTVKLNDARKAFEESKTRFGDLLFEVVDHKVDQFLTFAQPNFLPNAPKSHPNEFVMDVCNYLETTFAVMTYMPREIREALHFTSCKHISTFFLDLLLGNSVKAFNSYGICDLALDLAQLEEFAKRCRIPNLVETFGELRQV